jgi:hypothetical protein
VEPPERAADRAQPHRFVPQAHVGDDGECRALELEPTEPARDPEVIVERRADAVAEALHQLPRRELIPQIDRLLLVLRSVKLIVREPERRHGAGLDRVGKRELLRAVALGEIAGRGRPPRRCSHGSLAVPPARRTVSTL